MGNLRAPPTLLAEFLPPEFRERLDPDHPLELIEGASIDGEGKAARADAIFRARLKDGASARIHVLLEHKSQPDARTPLQLMRYIQRIWTKCKRDLKMSRSWTPKMSHSTAEKGAARERSTDSRDPDRGVESAVRRNSPERGEAMHEGTKRVAFRSLLRSGLSKAEIARELGVSRRTVIRWTAIEESGREHEAFCSGPRAPGPSILDRYAELMRLRLAEHPRLSAVRVFQDVRDLGYAGSYDAVKRWVRRLRREPGTLSHRLARLNPLPGLAERRPASALTDQPQAGAQTPSPEAAEAAFGTPKVGSFQLPLTELLFDQMKAVTIKDRRSASGGLLRNAEFTRFAAHHGFVIRACRPYRAQTKGKVERLIRHIRGGFFEGREFASDGDLNARALGWLAKVANARVHATLKEVPLERLERERSSLGSLAKRPYMDVAQGVPAPLEEAAPVVVERRSLAEYGKHGEVGR